MSIGCYKDLSKDFTATGVLDPIRSETDHLAMDLAELWAIFGPGFSGAVFGTGWWFWVDAVVCSSIQVPFLHYLPGKKKNYISVSQQIIPPPPVFNSDFLGFPQEYSHLSEL